MGAPGAGHDRMTGLESLMWRMGGDGSGGARFAATMTLAMTLARPIRLPALLNRLQQMVLAVPRLACVPSVPALATVPPVWVRDPDFAVERHVRAVRLPLSEMVAGLLDCGFHSGRPPWTVVVAADEPIVVFHLHHSYTDGTGGVALLGRLMDFGAETVFPGDVHTRPPTPDAVWELTEQARTLAALLPWAGRTLVGSVTRPEAVLDAAGKVAASLGATARAALGPVSPALVERSEGASVARVDLEVPALRATARRLNLTINDVYLAGLLDGLSRYHVKRGAPAPSLRLGLPISARTGQAEMMSNQLLGAVLRAPLGRIDFDERARLVHEMVLDARRQPWADVTGHLGDLLARIPYAHRVMSSATSALDVLASNVAGPDFPLSLIGAQVASMVPFGPRAGAAINATLLSYCGRVSIGLNLDPAAVGDPDVLVDCLLAAFDEGCTQVG